MASGLELRFNGPMRGWIPLVCATVVLACRTLPPAAVDETPAPPIVHSEAEPDTKSLALLPQGTRLYAQPELDASSVSLEGHFGVGLDGRVVEILARESADAGAGWWRVQTLDPLQAQAEGYEAEAGLDALVLIGWTPAQPELVVERPAGRAWTASESSKSVEAEVDVQAVSSSYAVARGQVVVWPDDSVAGEVIVGHGFFRAPSVGGPSNGVIDPNALAPEPDAQPYSLVCWDERRAPRVGKVVGRLCYRHEPGSQHDTTEIAVELALDERKKVPRVRLQPATVTGPLDADIVRRIVRAHINEIRSCYYGALDRDETIGGLLELEFVVAAAGTTTNVSVATNELGDPALGTCAVAAVKSWRFPKPRGGKRVTIRYPFDLQPG